MKLQKQLITIAVGKAIDCFVVAALKTLFSTLKRRFTVHFYVCSTLPGLDQCWTQRPTLK